MIEFKSVSKTYPDGTKAVTDLDLVVPSDGITVFVGPSGCGKTTTLRMINRMIEPTKGSIVWDGTPIKQMRRTTLRRQMGYVIQNGGLFPHRTVIENIATVPELLGWKNARIVNRANELLEMVGLEAKLAKRYPAQLSGGQQQRVGVARALAADPDLLLMDEPFSAIDPVVRKDLQILVQQLQRDLNKTIVMITHDMDEAITMGDRVAVLRVGGVLAQFGTPAEILDNPADDFVRDFVGRERGYRSLKFADRPSLTMSRVRTVRNAAQAYSDSHGTPAPVLIVDAEGRPTGWADPKRKGRLLGLGTTFQIEDAPLRDVLESALTSPTGMAIAVSRDGRYAGVVPSADVMKHVARHRAAVADGQVADQVAAEKAAAAAAAAAEAARLAAEKEAAERLAAEQAAAAAKKEKRRGRKRKADPAPAAEGTIDEKAANETPEADTPTTEIPIVRPEKVRGKGKAS